MIRLLIAFALLLAAPATALGQARDAAPGLWTRGEDRITFAAARISLPLRAGAVALTRSVEFSRHGQGVDNGLQFLSQDEQIFATAYIYLPGLPHAGLTAFATEQAVRTQSGAQLRELGTRVVGASGQAGVAIRNDYAGFRDGMASSAAFIKVGRWIVKLRVSAPDARQAEVDATMTALLDGIKIDGAIRPRPAAPLEVGECPQQLPPARSLPGNYDQLLETALMSAFDGAGDDARDRQGNPTEALAARTGTRWCQSSRARIGDASYPILRAGPDAPANNLGARTVLVVPINDAGTILELVEIARGQRYAAFYHEIGRTAVLGSYDGPLSDNQVAEILSGADREGNRIRTTVDLLPNGNTNINMPPPSEPAPRPES